MYDNDLKIYREIESVCEGWKKVDEDSNKLADIIKKKAKDEDEARQLTKAVFTRERLNRILSDYQEVFGFEYTKRQALLEKFEDINEICEEDVQEVLNLIDFIQERKETLNRIEAEGNVKKKGGIKKIAVEIYNQLYGKEWNGK